MVSKLDKYVDSLLSFLPKSKDRRVMHDYVSLIHVPAQGSEVIYSLSLGEEKGLFTVARYKESLWTMAEHQAGGQELDALQVEIEKDHPFLSFLSRRNLEECSSIKEGGPGMDFFLMLWQMDGAANVVDAWEPRAFEHSQWRTVVSALQCLSSQYEYMTLQN